MHRRSANIEVPDSTTSHQWRRVRFWRTAALLGIPVAILSLASGLLFLALENSTPETFDGIHFWFYFFDVGREINVPTWFSSGLWMVAGILAALHSRWAVDHRRSWVLFAVVCIFLSVDEMLELHERLDVIGYQLAEFLPFNLGHVWVIPGAIITLVIVLALARLVFSLPSGVRNGLLLSGVVFVAGGMGFETLSGNSVAENGITPAFFVLTLIEETLEMAGLALCVAALAHLVEYRKNDDDSVTYRPARRTPAAS